MTTNFRIHYASLPGVLPLLSQGLLFTADWLQSRTLLAGMKTGSPKCGGPHKHSKKTTPIRLDLDLSKRCLPVVSDAATQIQKPVSLTIA